MCLHTSESHKGENAYPPNVNILIEQEYLAGMHMEEQGCHKIITFINTRNSLIF